MKKEVLSSKEVAWILDCSPDEVVELARRGELRAVKDGRFWKYRRKDVEAYKRKLEREATAEQASPFA